VYGEVVRIQYANQGVLAADTSPSTCEALPYISAQPPDHASILTLNSGGTNLRVGFIELTPDDGGASGAGPRIANGIHAGDAEESSRLKRLLERSWPIQEHLKNENAESLFDWIGSCIASVVGEGCESLGVPRDSQLPMGVTFSFPMEQSSLAEAKLMSMGKGFAITSQLDLGSQLRKGYEKNRTPDLPAIRIAAIANDSVSTLVSVIYEFSASEHQRAVMGLICGTGSNATLTMKLSSLHPSKRPEKLTGSDDARIAVNTEWSINGSAPPMRKLGLISRWDDEVSQSTERPGFQPLEYMTAGRYLGELGRIMLIDYMTTVHGLDAATFPAKLSKKFEPYNTTFLSHYRPGGKQTLLDRLNSQFPVENDKTSFKWTEDIANALYHITLAIQVRAAGIIAAATVGLLRCAEELPSSRAGSSAGGVDELVVGYTGGCILKFQTYLEDCQTFLDSIVGLEYGPKPAVRVVLRPCHDGGIKGAGILVPASTGRRGEEE